LHYSLSTEKTYLHWIKFFIRWRARDGTAIRHPREMGAPEEIANAIVWLASDAASYCTGALLDVAGGR
jgi:NAD(P)-dependent dehydrogenase (short-subunit alcohol dehydrogenase family)